MMKLKLDKKLIATLLLANIALFSCAQPNGTLTPEGQQGAAIGGILGTTAGVMLDQSNRWRGGVIGGAIGSILGSSLGEIASEAAQQAMNTNQPVQYTNGNQMIQAVPQKQFYNNNCKTITTYYYQNGQLIATKTEKICN